MTMFKKSGRGAKKPYCVNEECPNFTPEDKRGGYKKKVATTAEGETPAEDAKKPAKKPAAKKAAAKKPAAKKPAAKKPAAKKAVAKKPAAKKPAAKKATAKK
ncbi:MAG: DNA topoisomerase I, partial [Oscillospiraceae bacterium]